MSDAPNSKRDIAIPITIAVASILVLLGTGVFAFHLHHLSGVFHIGPGVSLPVALILAVGSGVIVSRIQWNPPRRFRVEHPVSARCYIIVGKTIAYLFTLLRVCHSDNTE